VIDNGHFTRSAFVLWSVLWQLFRLYAKNALDGQVRRMSGKWWPTELRYQRVLQGEGLPHLCGV
ncbi:MAG: hypothetical protein SVX38_13780, partial [Chloroflexota bacterium]|nr:hypothetical protein [Chloroflexota bacterium]